MRVYSGVLLLLLTTTHFFPLNAFLTPVRTVAPCWTTSNSRVPTVVVWNNVNGFDSTTENNDKPQQQQFSREVLLRTEAESPFRKIRFFLIASLGVSALASFVISFTRILAATLANINTDLLEESLINAGVDLVGMIVLSALYQRDINAEQTRLKAATKGAELAKLKIRASKSLIQLLDDEVDIDTAKTTTPASFTTSLASLRRGRGIEKRVVIACGGKEKIEQIVQEAKQMDINLVQNDLLIVPIVLSLSASSNVMVQQQQQLMNKYNDATNDTLPESIAIPVGVTDSSSTSWNSVLIDEINEAKRQNIDCINDGFCIVLKKNGRVGQRTKGIYLSNLMNNVVARRTAGMDVKNI